MKRYLCIFVSVINILYHIISLVYNYTPHTHKGTIIGRIINTRHGEKRALVFQITAVFYLSENLTTSY